MKKIYTLVAFALFIHLNAFSQQKYEIGAEAGVTNNKYSFSDPGNNLDNPPLISGIAGLRFRVNTKSKLFYETAVLFTEYVDGIKSKEVAGYGYTNADEVLMMPLRMGYQISLSKKWSLYPLIGVAPSIKITNSDGSGTYSTNPSADLEYTYVRRDLGKDFFVLMQTGLGIDYHLHKRIKAGLRGGYYFGFANHAVYDIVYRKSNTLYMATMTGKGNFIDYSFGLRYLFGKKI